MQIVYTNTVVFNLHQIKRQAFLGTPVVAVAVIIHWTQAEQK